MSRLFYKIYFFIFQLLFIDLTVSQVIPTPNPCVNSQCKNLASCLPLDPYSYNCSCDQYWTGVYCDQPTVLNLCFSQPCKMNSQCLFSAPYQAYKCICQPGYTGVACDVIINTCDSFPCKNKVKFTLNLYYTQFKKWLTDMNNVSSVFPSWNFPKNWKFFVIQWYFDSNFFLFS